VSTLRLYDDTDLEQLPPAAWLVDGILPENGLVVMFGERASFKTFAALDIAAHVSLGMPDWHGQTVRQGNVLYVYGEGRFGLTPRLKAWRRFHEALDVGILFCTQTIDLTSVSSCMALLGAFEERAGCRALGAVSLIVVDTLSRNASGNENSSEDMATVVRNCDFLREQTRACVLLVHHSGHGTSDRGRGSSVLDAAADTVIAVTRDDSRITLECRKQKDGPEFAPMAFEAMSVGGSLVLKPSGVNDGALGGQRLAVLLALHENFTDGAKYSPWMEAAGLKAKESSFNKSREWLRANAYVKSDRGTWRVTDAGNLALSRLATPPTLPTTPPLHSRAVQTTPPNSGGLYRPRSGVEDYDADERAALGAGL
jgi:hypothetical protein